MSADLNAALAKIHKEHATEAQTSGLWVAVLDLLDAIPEGAVLVAITRDDFHWPHGTLRGRASVRIEHEWAALEAQS